MTIPRCECRQRQAFQAKLQSSHGVVAAVNKATLDMVRGMLCWVKSRVMTQKSTWMTWAWILKQARSAIHRPRHLNLISSLPALICIYNKSVCKTCANTLTYVRIRVVQHCIQRWNQHSRQDYWKRFFSYIRVTQQGCLTNMICSRSPLHLLIIPFQIKETGFKGHKLK